MIIQVQLLTYYFLWIDDAIKTFEGAMIQHERIISNVIKEKPIQKMFFSDYFK
ncbi:MAG: hypothetical protein J7K34_09685 [Flavobacteriaceae bacterium]|nr:hypothetical protein [Flavobacteriaceae bacterium]